MNNITSPINLEKSPLASPMGTDSNNIKPMMGGKRVKKNKRNKKGGMISEFNDKIKKDKDEQMEIEESNLTPVKDRGSRVKPLIEDEELKINAKPKALFEDEVIEADDNEYSEDLDQDIESQILDEKITEPDELVFDKLEKGEYKEGGTRRRKNKKNKTVKRRKTKKINKRRGSKKSRKLRKKNRK